MVAVEELSNRVSRLEGAYEHLATKADLKGIQVEIARMGERMAMLETRLFIRNTAVIGAATGLIILVQSLT